MGRRVSGRADPQHRGLGIGCFRRLSGGQRARQPDEQLGVGGRQPGHHPPDAPLGRARHFVVVAGVQAEARRRDGGVPVEGAARVAAELGPGEAAFGRQGSQLGGRDFHPGPFGKQIGVQLGAVCSRGDLAVVRHDLPGRGWQVVGGDGREPPGPGGDGRGRQAAGVPRVRRTDVRDDVLRSGLGQGHLEEREALRVFQGRELARRPGYEQASRRGGQQGEELAGRGYVQLPEDGEGGRHGRDYVQAGWHARPLSPGVA